MAAFILDKITLLNLDFPDWFILFLEFLVIITFLLIHGLIKIGLIDFLVFLGS